MTSIQCIYSDARKKLRESLLVISCDITIRSSARTWPPIGEESLTCFEDLGRRVSSLSTAAVEGQKNPKGKNRGLG